MKAALLLLQRDNSNRSNQQQLIEQLPIIISNYLKKSNIGSILKGVVAVVALITCVMQIVQSNTIHGSPQTGMDIGNKHTSVLQQPSNF